MLDTILCTAIRLFLPLSLALLGMWFPLCFGAAIVAGALALENELES